MIYQEFKNPLRNCAVCLYSAGWGSKLVGKKLGVHHTLIRRWAKKAGFEKPRMDRVELFNRKKSEAAKIRKANKQPKPERVRLTEDEKRARAREYYHQTIKHKEGALEAARERVKQRYNRLKSDPSWMELRRQSSRDWRKLNKEKAKAINQRWFRNNAQRMREYRKDQLKNPIYKTVINLRRRLRDFVKQGERELSTSDLVGCSSSFLVQWLESQFERGMTWANYGKRWHIDHIIPCASYDLTKQDQQRACFHYSNLRPLWAEQNIAKGGRVIPTQPELLIKWHANS